MMNTTKTAVAPGSRTRGYGLLALFISLPFLVHLAGVGWYVLTADQITVTVTDSVVNSAAVVYLIVGVILLRFNPGAAMKLGTAAWALLLSLAVVELALAIALPERPAAAPWLPTMRISTAADTMPGISGKIELTVNTDLGLRAPQKGFESADLRVLCLGGSTTECLYVTDDKTWPRLLQKKLSDSLGCAVFVGNGGRSGHFTLHTIEKIRNYSAVDRFDLILIMSGINDMGTLLLGNYDEREKAVPYEALLRNPSRSERDRPYYAHSRLFAELLHASQMRTSNEMATEDPNTISQDDAGAWYTTARAVRRRALQAAARDLLPPNMDAAIDRYRANLRTIIELCRTMDIAVVLVTQPTLYEEHMPEEHKALLLGGVNRELGFAYTERVLTRVMEAFNNALLETCASERIDCIDLADLLPKDTSIFYDDCHFNVSGCERVSSILADRLSSGLSRLEISQR